MAAQKILVVEDDKNISRLVSYNLGKAGFECAAVSNGREAMNRLAREKFDLVVLDLMLPEVDGLEVCRRIRRDERLASLPVLMLTARGEEVDRVVGFEVGADDYVVKPFSPRELVLRVKAILKRRTEEDDARVLSAGDLVVDIPRHRATVGSMEVVLTPMEFNLLVVLMRRRGRVQSRDILLEVVWGILADVATRTVDTHIRRLRRKLGKAGGMIETVRGVGYRLTAEV